MRHRICLLLIVSLVYLQNISTLEAQYYSTPPTSPSGAPTPISSPRVSPTSTPSPNKTATPVPTLSVTNCLKALGGESTTSSIAYDASEGYDVYTTVVVTQKNGYIERATYKSINVEVNEASIDGFFNPVSTSGNPRWTEEATVSCSQEKRLKYSMKFESAPLSDATGNCQFQVTMPETVSTDTLYTADFKHRFFIKMYLGIPEGEIAPAWLESYEQFFGDKLANDQSRPKIWTTNVALRSPDSDRYSVAFEKTYAVKGQNKKISGRSAYNPLLPDFECFYRDEIQDQSYTLWDCNAPDALSGAHQRQDTRWLQVHTLIWSGIGSNKDVENGNDICRDGRLSAQKLEKFYSGN